MRGISSRTSATMTVGALLMTGCGHCGEVIGIEDCLRAQIHAEESELIITASPGNAHKLRDVLASASLACAAQLQIDGACLVRIPWSKGQDIEAIATKLRGNILELGHGTAPPNVQKIIGKVIVNFEFEVPKPDGHPFVPLMTAEPLFRYQVELAALGAPAAWFDAQDSNVLTAIIDNGIRIDHEDLKGQFRGGVTIGCTEEPCDGSQLPKAVPREHGTLVAGIAAAHRADDEDSAGVAWNTKFISIHYGRIDEFRTSCALQHAIARKVDIVSGSWTEVVKREQTIKKPWRVFEKYIRRAQDNGILVVFAAGNHRIDVDQWPLNPLRLRSPNMLGVMAFDVANNGLVNLNYGHHTVQIAAPHFASVTTSVASPSGYVQASGPGASWSTAFVSGAAALLKSHYPRSDYDFLKWRIMANATPDARLRELNESGGILNLVGTIFPVVSLTGDLSKTHAMPIDWKTGLRADMCREVSIKGRSVDGEKKGPWFEIIASTPNDGTELIPPDKLAGVSQDKVQIRVQCPDEILGADSLPIPLH